MNDLLSVVQRIARHEQLRVKFTELCRVKAVHPDGYSCDVEIEGPGLVLHQVPVLTQHVGAAALPSVGDLVLVTFAHGDLDRPIVIGRIYHQEAKPKLPKCAEHQLIVEHPKFRIAVVDLDSDPSLELTVGKTSLKIDAQGNLAIEAGGTTEIRCRGDLTLESEANLSLKAAQSLKLEAGVSADMKAMNIGIQGMTSFSQ